MNPLELLNTVNSRKNHMRQNIPLSHGQEGLFLDWMLHKDGAEYNAFSAWQITSPLDDNCIQIALQKLAERHQLVTATFALEDGIPVQSVDSSVGMPYRMVDSSGWNPAILDHEIQTEANRPFDLANGPVFRAHRFKSTETDSVILFNCHHICMDGWSMMTFLEEFGTLYMAAVSGLETQVLPPSTPFADYVESQQSTLSGEKGEKLWEYWKAQLSGELPQLELPTDYPRPKTPVYDAGNHPFILDKDLITGIENVAQQLGTSLYTIVLTTFHVLLNRYTGQEDIIVISPRLGRIGRKFDRTLGYFATPGPVRLDLSNDPLFSDLVAILHRNGRAQTKYQGMPWPTLIKRLQADGALGRRSLSTVSLNFQKTYTPLNQEAAVHCLPSLAHGGADGNLGGLVGKSYPLALAQIAMELELMMEPIGDTLFANFFYFSSLWKPSTIVRMAEHFRTLLQGVVANPACPIWQLPMLSDAEKEQQLRDWNSPASTPRSFACLHHGFERQVELTPEKRALTFESTHMTYATLNQRANQLAHHLQRQGIGPEHRVGLCLERSMDLIVGMLGILKAGAAYVPMDPTYPPHRLAYILTDSGVTSVLTQESVSAQLPHSDAIHLLFLDTNWETISQQPDTNPVSTVGARNLAYIIYTSGSTGMPKGVMVEHCNVCNLAHHEMRAVDRTKERCILQFASANFDASVGEIFLTLLTGSRLCLARKETLIPGAGLMRLLRQEKITHLCLPPSVLQTLPEIELPDLRTIVVAGEFLPRKLAERWAPGRKFENGYGPTEVTVVCNWGRMDINNEEALSIGAQLSNTKLYILGKHLELLPAGAVGELYIAGGGVTRGYLFRPELTAERYIPNPFSSEAGSRLYKSGDLARYLPSGKLEYIGRNDDQVKIRGFRIELGEIEAVLNQFSSISQSLVLATDDQFGGKRLVAYLIPATGAINTNALRASLKSTMPDHLVPAFFVSIPAFPLTPNGKIDKRALPSPEASLNQTTKTNQFIAPEHEIECKIATVWQSVLQQEQVGLDDNFFDLGGHSLLLLKIEAALQQCGIKVSTVDLFRFTTIRSLAAHLTKHEQITQFELSGAALRLQPPPVREWAQTTNNAIAIIGMAGRFPGANSVDQFWENLCNGVESIVELSDEQLAAAKVDPLILQNPNYVKREGVLDGVSSFDAALFRYTPRDAELLDPQQRALLETAWEALEDAGYGNQGEHASSVGVFAGMGTTNYMLNNILSNPAVMETRDLFQIQLLNDKDFVATRIAYKLNLKGPAFTVQSGCSTALVAVDLACTSLLSHKCDMALAGGAAIKVPHASGYLYQEGHILSPDGRCRAFDADAHGTAPGSGSAMVVLKRLADAEADGDHIWAIIKGSAINNDGAHKAGFTAPSVDGQAEVISAALAQAQVDARSIGYVECHGTATPLGDPIEIAALTKAYRQSTDAIGFCAIGSVKTNIGHLDSAAGVTGLIKAALCLYHKKIPESLHFQRANSKLELDGSPFHVNRSLTDWTTGDLPRRAAVSSFGIGGTNAHVVLEEAPEQSTNCNAPCSQQLLLLSAANPAALARLGHKLAQGFQAAPEQNLANIAHTLAVGRATLAHRQILVCRDTRDAALGLGPEQGSRRLSGFAEGNKDVFFMFSGQGSQHVNMGCALYNEEPVFRATIDECATLLQELLGIDMRTVLYPDNQAIDTSKRFNEFIQPIFFSVQYALAKLWLSWGVQPRAMIGHSVGEYAMACIAGVMSLFDALQLVTIRGKLVQSTSQGAVIAISMRSEQLKHYLGAGLSLAVVNAPKRCLVSGTQEAVVELNKRLLQIGVHCHVVKTSHAVHSSLLDPILEEFAAHVRQATLHPPKLAYVSSVTGGWVNADEVCTVGYWVRNLRDPVLFGDGIEKLLMNKNCALLEIGPGHALANLVRRHPGRSADQIAFSSLPNSHEIGGDRPSLLTTLGKLWLSGVNVDWRGLFPPDQHRRVALPTYPFERTNHWVTAGVRAETYTTQFNTRSGDRRQQDRDRREIDLGPLLTTEISAPGQCGEIEYKLIQIFQKVLGLDELGIHDRFSDIGGDSLVAITVVTKIERYFGRRLPVAVLLEKQTPHRLALLLADTEKLNQQHSLLVEIQIGSGNLPPLFCIHPYGGHVVGYYPLAHLFGPEQSVYGIESQGLDNDAPPYTDLVAMAANYVEIIREIQPQGPYYLLGHSMGGNIAWEMACQLQLQGQTVGLLALFDAKANNLLEIPLYQNANFSGSRVPAWLSEEAAILGAIFPPLRAHWQLLEKTAKPDQWRHLLKKGIARGAIPEMGESEIARIISVTIANDLALRTFEPKPYAGKVVQFAAIDGFRLQFREEVGDDLGFAQLTTNGLEVELIPGDHRTLTESPNVQVLYERLLHHLGWSINLPALLSN